MEKHSVARLIGAPPGYVGYEEGGVLTDGHGRTVDFKQTLIVLTLNLGSQALSRLEDGGDAARAKQDVMDAVRAHFRPEFLNRLDDQIVFDRLDRADMAGIVDIQLARLQKRLAPRKITLELDEAARAWLAEQGYDPVYGARPLGRVIQTALQNPLAEAMLGGEIRDGDTVPVTAGSDGLIVGERLGSSDRPKPDDAVVH
jgi:ATP-dependent Clp protease ATP-binding subunit ClpB